MGGLFSSAATGGGGGGGGGCFRDRPENGGGGGGVCVGGVFLHQKRSTAAAFVGCYLEILAILINFICAGNSNFSLVHTCTNIFKRAVIIYIIKTIL